MPPNRKSTWRYAVRPVRIEGNMGVITLNTGAVALVDADDVHLVEGWNWTATVEKSGLVYAVCWLGRQRTKLHNLILPHPPGFLTDHADRDGLNCRRYNLRIATHAQNCQNRKLSSANTSGFKGVCYRSDRNTWLAVFCHRKLGTFQTAEEAARAYDRAAQAAWGAFAFLNFPDEATV